ncbi:MULTISPECIES: hypothetical protein [unclassified Saccharothrix]|uniref:hypothetical protein n=1 Tax=unclassified Saccharothrix TaxID=2593673 RepID=UPI00307DED06
MITFVLGVALAFLVVSWTSGPDATERRVEELRQAEAQRDVEQIGALIELARGTRDRLTPVLVDMAKVAPFEAVAPVAPTAEQVRGWKDVVLAEVKRYEQTPSAGNGVNVARTGMRTAVDQLVSAVSAFDAAVEVEEPARSRFVGLAAGQRTLALRTWSVAALQLDVISIEAGKGHVHVYLPSGSGSGAVTPDSSPEGTG